MLFAADAQSWQVYHACFAHPDTMLLLDPVVSLQVGKRLTGVLPAINVQRIQRYCASMQQNQPIATEQGMVEEQL
jgi:HPt (histidine-containing phosphotransfer) domain-containing protein